MKRNTLIYWIFTGPLAALMLVGSIPDIMSVPDAVELFDHLGYPHYLLPFLGIAKLLGVAAILIPGFPRIKEWAYAGLVFDLGGAMYSSISVGDPAGSWLPVIIGFLFIAGSYVFYHKRSKAAASIHSHSAYSSENAQIQV